jgi:hypothetical protein
MGSRSSIIFVVFVLLCRAHSGVDTPSDLAHLAAVVARVEVIRVVTLKTGEQQATARVEEQITGRPLETEITIWNGNSPGVVEQTGRKPLHKGEYLMFLDWQGTFGYTACVSSNLGFLEIRDGTIDWRGKRLLLTDLLRNLPRSGIEP